MKLKNFSRFQKYYENYGNYLLKFNRMNEKVLNFHVVLGCRRNDISGKTIYLEQVVFSILFKFKRYLNWHCIDSTGPKMAFFFAISTGRRNEKLPSMSIIDIHIYDKFSPKTVCK